jgi:hypothetical protein
MFLGIPYGFSTSISMFTPGFESKSLGKSPPVWRTRASACGWGRSLTSAHQSADLYFHAKWPKNPPKPLFFEWRFEEFLWASPGSAKLLVGHWKPGHRWVPPRLPERLSLRKPVDLEPMKKQIKTHHPKKQNQTEASPRTVPHELPEKPTLATV